MKRPAKKTAKKLPKAASQARRMSSHDLCVSLTSIAGFAEDEDTSFKIYEAVRRLQLLEKAAVDAGLLPAATVR